MNYKVLGIAAVIIIAALAVAAYLVTAGAQSSTVAAGDNISVFYTGAFTNGTVFNTNVGGQPFSFTVGTGMVINGFDSGVIGMSLNQTKTITIPADEAYGPVNPSLIINVPLSAFNNASGNGSSVHLGMLVTETNPTGQEYQGIVTAMNATNATVNFNPPLAGKTLVFTIRVVSIKK